MISKELGIIFGRICERFPYKNSSQNRSSQGAAKQASRKKKVIYAVCINGDHHHIITRAKIVSKLGGNAIHINHWSGLGACLL